MSLGKATVSPSATVAGICYVTITCSVFDSSADGVIKMKRIHLLLATLAVACLVPFGAAARNLQTEAPDDSSARWGGPQVILQRTAQGATLQFDCAHAVIQQPITPDAKGDFTASGTYTPERGGPARKDSPPKDLPATFRGNITGDTMQLEITFSGDQSPLQFTLTQGKMSKLIRCR